MNKTTLLLFISGFALISNAQVSKSIQPLKVDNSLKTILSTNVDTSEPFYEIVPQQNHADKPSKVSLETLSEVVDITPGGLMASLATTDLSNIYSLTITGIMDARDFKTIRDNLSHLSELDISGASVQAYTGTEGTSISTESSIYPENEIPSYAFYNNISKKSNTTITRVVLPSTITSIGSYAFQYCFSLNSINIPLSVVTIGTGSFYDCRSIVSFFIPSSVTSIGDKFFLGCNCNITVDPDNLNYSSNDGILFDKNQSLLIKYPTNKPGEYIIPSTVKSIGNLAFFGCNSLYSITIPSSVTILGSQAFSYCGGLTSVFIPSTVTSLSNSVFAGSLCAITVDANNPNYSSAEGLLFNKNKSILMQATTFLTGTYNIPLSVSSIGFMAFFECKGLTAVTIPSSVTTISGNAFYHCTQLTTANIPASIINIGSSAFYNCTALTSIYSDSSNPVNLTNSMTVFYGVDKTACNLYVPTGSIAAYASANQWSDFKNVIEMTTGLNSPTSEPITVYPNPVIQSFRVKGLKDSSSITLTDLNGNILLSKPVTPDESVSLSTLPKGMYILKFSNAGETRQCKVVKN